MVKMVTLKGHPYRGRNWMKGDVLEVDAGHVKLLEGLGRARLHVEPPVKKVVATKKAAPSEQEELPAAKE